MAKSYHAVRDHFRQNLASLFVKLLYQHPFTIYISDVGGLYRPDYDLDNWVGLSYQGRFAFVMMPDDDFVLVMLHATKHSDIYRVTEVPMAFSRMPTRKLEVNMADVVCILEPCSKK